MKALGQYELWFVAGCQDLYGEAAIAQVGADAREVCAALDEAAPLAVRVITTPVVVTPESFRRICLEADADLLAADARERADRDVPAELIGKRRQHARDRLAVRRPRGCVGAVRVDDATDAGHRAVDEGVGRGVARGRELALDDVPVQVDEHHRARVELVVADAARLDHDQVRVRHARRDVPARPRDQPVANELRVEIGDGLAQLRDDAHRTARSRSACSERIRSRSSRPKKSWTRT